MTPASRVIPAQVVNLLDLNGVFGGLVHTFERFHQRVHHSDVGSLLRCVLLVEAIVRDDLEGNCTLLSSFGDIHSDAVVLVSIAA